MGVLAGIRKLLYGGGDVYERRAAGRKLDVPSGYNVRELGDYETASGTVLRHRYLRSGGTDSLVASDIDYLRGYGVTHVLDLRGDFENPRRTCRFARCEGIVWKNVELYAYDISDPSLAANRRGNTDDYLVDSYLTMLANRAAVRRVMQFFARANARGHTCTLFHCAAGMDRTGMVAMLLLGLAGANRTTIVADYAYSFGSVGEVDAAIALRAKGDDDQTADGMTGRIRTIETTYDTLVGAYGSVRDYLTACDLTAGELDAVVASMVGA